MRQAKFILVLFLIIFISSFSLIIDQKFAYADNPVTKLGRGLTNLATGWLEIPKEIAAQLHEKGEIPAFLSAPWLGLVKGLGRMLVGIYDAATCLIPFPKGYKPVIQPEYVFEKSNQT